MPNLVRDVMTADPATVSPRTTLLEAARLMREADIGEVPVVEGRRLVGILTDRDLVVRGIAPDLDVHEVPVSRVCSTDVVSVAPDDPLEQAVAQMRDRAVRRLPVVDDNAVVGVITIGDLAMAKEPGSLLAEISNAVPNV
ncbi:CBS domain-containing protein [Allostreptomyces psammosilenae]|uniref:CBS domain-containing protein n=1 Tax=Allostreptomyces psammosilenae TaxID=1892865 RepID=A0A853A077_9ACTN|nr:CBS domain-containing protein [Allostreptomyces psammosilenae]NYI06870.1 CBS domain-containing protein [Allostreptomyces psammosilenae]